MIKVTSRMFNQYTEKEKFWFGVKIKISSLSYEKGLLSRYV